VVAVHQVDLVAVAEAMAEAEEDPVVAEDVNKLKAHDTNLSFMGFFLKK
jgi:hypothetical protein